MFVALPPRENLGESLVRTASVGVTSNGAVYVKDEFSPEDACQSAHCLSSAPPESIRLIVVSAPLKPPSLSVLLSAGFAPSFRCLACLDLSECASSIDPSVLNLLTALISSGSVAGLQKLLIGVPDSAHIQPFAPSEHVSALFCALASGRCPYFSKIALRNIQLDDSALACLIGLTAALRRLQTVSARSVRAPAHIRSFFSSLHRRADPPPFPQGLLSGPLSRLQVLINSSGLSREGARNAFPYLTGTLDKETSGAEAVALFA